MLCFSFNLTAYDFYSCFVTTLFCTCFFLRSKCNYSASSARDRLPCSIEVVILTESEIKAAIGKVEIFNSLKHSKANKEKL